MNEITTDYKNGFNECADLILKRLDFYKDKITYSSDESISSLIITIKQEILESCFMNKKL